jgi:hypothetical protein
MAEPEDVTRLLIAWRGGEQTAFDAPSRNRGPSQMGRFLQHGKSCATALPLRIAFQRWNTRTSKHGR